MLVLFLLVLVLFLVVFLVFVVFDCCVGVGFGVVGVGDCVGLCWC